MRSSISIKALALALLQGASALDLARMREYGEMAEMGLYPDGTPMQQSSETMSLFAAPPPPPTQDPIVAEYVKLPLDHFSKGGYSNAGSYYNRFWVSTDAYKPGAPVFLYDVGEADGQPYVASRLGRNTNTTNSFRAMVDKYQGIGIVWEHRYCK